MLFSTITLLSISALASASNVGRPVRWQKLAATPNNAGFETVSTKFRIDPSSPRIKGYYAAASWDYANGGKEGLHYFGLQPKAPGSPTNGHLAYSSFGPNVHSGDDSRCSTGADGGSGVSCSLDIDFDYGRWYNIESTVVETKPDGSRRWNGTLIDDAGGKTYIASIWSDASIGGIGGRVATWLEWWPYNTQDDVTTRACQPKFKASFGNPTAGGQPVADVGYIAATAKDDPCAIAAGKANYESVINSDKTLTITAGFLTK